MNVSIDGRKASAARKIAEKFIYDRVIRGSTVKNFTGLVNNASCRRPTRRPALGHCDRGADPRRRQHGAERRLHQLGRDGDRGRGAAADGEVPVRSTTPS
jgi:hypothetical protein